MLLIFRSLIRRGRFSRLFGLDIFRPFHSRLLLLHLATIFAASLKRTAIESGLVATQSITGLTQSLSMQQIVHISLCEIFSTTSALQHLERIHSGPILCFYTPQKVPYITTLYSDFTGSNPALIGYRHFFIYEWLFQMQKKYGWEFRFNNFL